jgi:hypothetical protein
MASNPPYVPGLPPHIRQEFLNRWSSSPTPVPTWPAPLPQVPVRVPDPAPPRVQDSDPIVGTWITSGGAWHFTRDGNGYSFTETSVLGQTGEGRATLEGQILSVDFTSAMLGRMSIAFTLDSGVLQGTMPFWGVPIPFVLRRA